MVVRDFKRICISFIVFLISYSVYANESVKDKVGLLVMLDMSASTKNHRQKLKNLAPIVRKAMESSSCDFKIGVGNIAYDNLRRNDLKPWGQPSFVTADTPNGDEMIWERISDPELVLFPNGTVSGDDETPRGNRERTYSSMVESIEQNLPDLQDVVSLGVLLLTDTAPAFEIYGPQIALNRISDLLGSRPFIPGMIRPSFFEGMMFEHWENSNADDGAPVCRLDIPGQQIPGNQISTLEWQSRDIEAMDTFIERAWGMSWDVCDKDYDDSLEAYLQTVLNQSGCLLMM